MKNLRGICILGLTLTSGLVMGQLSTNRFVNTSGDGKWETASNWSAGLPTSTNIARFDGGKTGTVSSVRMVAAVEVDQLGGFIVNGTTVSCGGDRVSAVGLSTNGTMSITNGGTVICSTNFIVGAGGVSNSANGVLTISNGTLVVAKTFGQNTGAGWTVALLSNSVTRTILAQGASIQAESIDIKGGVIEFNGGQMTISSNAVTEVQAHITASRMVAGPQYYLDVQYDTNTLITTVSSAPASLEMGLLTSP
ncbi:MAG: hypothetical protein FJ220_07005 [Kiritimatiellaceae bacterium]|nr:hypothetical protein [Kiritimatiellaceae bacterium]